MMLTADSSCLKKKRGGWGELSEVCRVAAKTLAATLLTMPGIAAGAAQHKMRSGAGNVTQERVLTSGGDLSNWLLHGRTFQDQRYTPAEQINQKNIHELKLAWYTDIPTQDGLIAAPIVVDGVMYISAPLSKVYALDATSGQIKWSYDPQVKLDTNYMVSFGARSNRGVAVWEGKVIVGTADCRLIALDANTGIALWDVKACDSKNWYYKNAAPRVGGGMVFSGTSGSEVGVRGLVDAYDANTGKRLWRFYTVPKPQGPQENAALEMAAKTWTGGGEKYGGGTTWDAMTYDPELGLLYVGTAGSFPPSHKERSPGGGDNLFLESIIALNARTGEYVWHFQTTPEDNYDFNANFHMILADLAVNGKSRKVLMTAPKNGYFYTLDRTNGKPVSIGPLTKRINWAAKMDLKSGRPTWDPKMLPQSLAPGKCFTMFPGAWGAHNWHAMSYSPLEKLVYLPITNLGNKMCMAQDGEISSEDVMHPQDEHLGHGSLLAWDPVAAKVRWRVPRVTAYSGGTLATGGGLVFQGTGDGLFQAINANTGKVLWSYEVGSAIQGPPVSVVLNGEQYVMVPAGESSMMTTLSPDLTGTKETRGAPTRMIAFKLRGGAVLPHFQPVAPTVPKPPDMAADAAQIKLGKQLYNGKNCAYCHGADVHTGVGRSTPSLLYMSQERHVLWDGIVVGGMLREKGMLPFALSIEESRAIQAYVISKQLEAYEKQKKEASRPTTQ